MRRSLILAGSLIFILLACGGGGGSDPAEQSTDTAAITTSTASSSTPSTTASTTSTTATTTTTTLLVAPAPIAFTLDELLGLGRPVVLGHAGGDQDFPHSTPFGFSEAARSGVDALELDVQLSADGILIVQHDDTVDRTTESSGPVRELTLSEIQALDNAYWFVPGFWGNQTRPPDEYVFRGVRNGQQEPPAGYQPDDFSVATFRQIAERFPNHFLDIEIKVQRRPDGEDDISAGIAAAQVLADEIAELGRTDSTIVVSFSSEVMRAFREAAPDVATSPGIDELVAWFFGSSPLDPADRVLQLPPFRDGLEILQPDLIDRAHDEGYAIWAWMDDADTQENGVFYEELLERDVDGIIAGRPREAVEAAAA